MVQIRIKTKDGKPMRRGRLPFTGEWSEFSRATHPAVFDQAVAALILAEPGLVIEHRLDDQAEWLPVPEEHRWARDDAGQAEAGDDEVEDLKERLETTWEKVESLERQLADANATIENLNGQLATTLATIETQQADLQARQTLIEELRAAAKALTDGQPGADSPASAGAEGGEQTAAAPTADTKTPPKAKSPAKDGK